jgi:phage/plasmid-associated DNA primase
MYVDNEGLEKLEPERVKLATNKYKADSNVIMEFFNEALEKDSESSILLNDIYEMFKGWYTNSYNDKKPLPRKKLIEYFESNGFDINKNNGSVKGIRGKDPSQVDISEFDSNL